MSRSIPVSSSSRRRTSSSVVAGLLVVVLMSGCGGGGGGGGGSDFTSQAKKVCTDALKRIGAQAETGGGSEASKIRTEATAALRKLTAPPEKLAQFTRLLDARDDIVAAYREGQKSTGDITDASTGRSLDALQRSADAAEKVGLPACAL